MLHFRSRYLAAISIYECEAGTHNLIAVLRFFSHRTTMINQIHTIHFYTCSFAGGHATNVASAPKVCALCKCSGSKIKIAAHAMAFNQIECVDNITFTCSVTAELCAIIIENQPKDI